MVLPVITEISIHLYYDIFGVLARFQVSFIFKSNRSFVKNCICGRSNNYQIFLYIRKITAFNLDWITHLWNSIPIDFIWIFDKGVSKNGIKIVQNCSKVQKSTKNLIIKWKTINFMSFEINGLFVKDWFFWKFEIVNLMFPFDVVTTLSCS